MIRFLFATLFFTTYLFAQDAEECNADRILGLMAQKGLINLEDGSFCLSLDNLPAVKINMNESYDISSIGLNNISEHQMKQDQSVNKIINFLKLNSGKTSADIKINATGFADGIRNIKSNFDAQIQNEILIGNRIAYNNLEKVMKDKDPNGFQNIVEYLKLKKDEVQVVNLDPNSPSVDYKLLSMIRNFYLAETRAKGLCERIKNSSTIQCNNKTSISAQLETGKGCFEGCCDGRRGAIIEVIPGEINNTDVPGSGRYTPPFQSPNPNFQLRLQLAASLSVVDLNIEGNKEIDDSFKNGSFNFPAGEGEDWLTKDRERFRKALKDTGCAENNFSVDSVRKIWWGIKKFTSEPGANESLKTALARNDFADVNRYFQVTKERLTPSEATLFTMLYTGGNVQPIGSKIDKACSSKRFHSIKNIPDKNISPIHGCRIQSSDPFFANGIGNLEELNKKYKDNKEIFVVSDKDFPGRYYVYDETNKATHYFNLDWDFKAEKSVDTKNKTHCAPNSSGWTTSKADDFEKNEDVSLASTEFPTSECFESAVVNPNSQNGFNFFPSANFVDGVVPTDSLNCLSATKAIENEVKNNSINTHQKPYCDLQKHSSDPVTLEFNPSSLESINGASHSHNGINCSAKHQGFMCTGCSSGIFYDFNKNTLDYTPRYKEPNSTNVQNAQKSWSQSAQGIGAQNNPLSIGNMKNLKTYLIPNCGDSCQDACKCLSEGSIEERLKGSDVKVFNFGTKVEGNKIVSDQKDKAGSYSCIFTPPVPHTCSFNPLGQTDEEDQSIAGLRKQKTICDKLIESPMPNVLPKYPTSSAITHYRQVCLDNNFPMDEEKCKNDEGPVCRKEKIKLNSENPSCSEPKPNHSSPSKKVTPN